MLPLLFFFVLPSAVLGSTEFLDALSGSPLFDSSVQQVEVDGGVYTVVGNYVYDQGAISLNSSSPDLS